MLVRDLSWLLALAEQGNVTEAASVLGVSQPTLSRALARVEAEVGVRLFDRVPDGVRLRPAGEEVLQAARDITGRYAELSARLAAQADPDAGVVRLAFLDSMATSLVPRMLRDFHAHAPGVKVLLAQEPAHHIERDLAVGEAELAVTSHRPDGDFGWLPLQEQRLVVVLPPTHRLSGRRRLTPSDLAGEELITTPLGYGYRELVQQVLAEVWGRVRISFESADLATIEGLTSAGLGVAVLPEQFVGVTGSVGVELRADGARRGVGLTWRTDEPLAPPAARMVDFLRGWAAGEKAEGARR